MIWPAQWCWSGDAAPCRGQVWGHTSNAAREAADASELRVARSAVACDAEGLSARASGLTDCRRLGPHPRTIKKPDLGRRRRGATSASQRNHSYRRGEK